MKLGLLRVAALGIMVFLNPALLAGKYARVVNSAPYLVGAVVEKIKTVKDWLDIDDIYRYSAVYYDPVIDRYVVTKPPSTGAVWYCKHAGIEYCLHENWIKDISDDEGMRDVIKTNGLVTAVLPNSKMSITDTPEMVAYMMRKDAANAQQFENK